MFKPIEGQKPIHVSDPDKEYHGYKHEIQKGDPAFVMSRSELWKFFQCPEEWIECDPVKPTGPMEFGSLVDCLLLTPDQFEARYAISPATYGKEGKKWIYSANECKEWRAAREAEGRSVVTTDQVNDALAAVKKYKAHPRLREFLKHSDTQTMYLLEWHDDETGMVIPFRVMCDMVPAPSSEFGDTIGDLKCTDHMEAEKWRKHVYYDGYYFQGGLYLDAVNAATGLEYLNFENHLIKSKGVHCVAHRRIIEDWLMIGKAHYKAAMRQYCKSLKTKIWPGYDCDDVSPLPYMVGGIE